MRKQAVSRGVTLAVFLTLGVSRVAEAKPVLWFHFDEMPCGSECVISRPIVNAADIEGAADLNGTARGLLWNSTTLDNNSWRVTYTNAFDLSTTWIDPKTGAKGDVRGAYIHVSGEVGTSPDGVGHAGVVTVPDDGKLHLDAFTVEFFMRRNLQAPYASQVLPLQLYNTPSNTAAWQIRFGSCGIGATSSSAITINAHRRDGTVLFNTDTVKHMQAGKCTPRYSLFDGGWHHIALTYDGAKCCLYCDYLKLVEVDAALEYAEDPADAILSIGNSARSTWGRFHGSLDELRISDEVLEPKEFLRAIPIACDKDTLVYIPFDRVDRGKGDFGYFGLTNNLNAVFPVSAQRFPTGDAMESVFETRLSAPPAVPVVSNEVPAAEMRDGLLATNVIANAGSLYLDDNSYYLSVYDDTADWLHTPLTNESYTFEWFYRRKPGDAAAVSLLTGYMSYTGGNAEGKTGSLYVGLDGSGYVYVSATTTNAFTSAGEYPYVGAYGRSLHPAWREKSIGMIASDDTSWHHFAFVGNRTRRTCQLCFDYQPVILFTNTVVLTRKYAGPYVKGFTFGGAYNSGSFRGFLDEIRITARELSPREFLSKHGAGELNAVNGRNALFYAPFDEDLKAYPFKGTFGNPTTAGTVSRSAADLPNVPRGDVPVREKMGLPAATAQSLQLTEGKVYFSNPVCLSGLDAFTVEWYSRLKNPGSAQPIMYFEGVRPSSDDRQWPKSLTYAPILEICGGGAAPKSLMLNVFSDYADSEENRKTLYWTAPQYRRNSWHHFAMTCRKVTVDGVRKLECHLYVDHKEADRSWAETPYVDAAELLPTTMPRLYLGGASSWASTNGAYDEVRFTEGVLSTDEMLPAVRPKGLVVIAR